MHYYKCPKLNNRVKLMLMNKKLNNYLFMLFLVNKLYHVYILIFIVILFYLMLRKHLKKSKNKTIFQLKQRVKLFVNVVDDKQTDSTSENICMNIDMSINDDECIILYTCTKSMCNILSICHNSVSSLMLMRQYNNNSVYKHVKASMIFNVNKYPCKNSPFKYGNISQLITVYIYHKHERPWFFPRLLIVTTLIKSIKKCQQTDEIYANRYNYDYNNNYLCLYTTGTIKNKCALLRNVCEQEKLLVNMKIQYQLKYRKMFKNIYMYLPVQAQSNPKLSYFEHVRNFSDIFQSINNITMVVIGIYTLTHIISHHHVELKSTLCILYHTCTLSNRQLHAIVVLVSWHETVEGQDSCTCKLLKPFNGIKH